ncbi:MAG: hypothetical protein U0361_14760 [Nitrospiraceae bacterium]
MQGGDPIASFDGIRSMADHGRTHPRAGAVASIEGIVHPITAARLVLEETGHVLPSAIRIPFCRALRAPRAIAT